MENVRLNEFLELHSAFEGSLSVAISKKTRGAITENGNIVCNVLLTNISSDCIELTKILRLKVEFMQNTNSYIEYEFCEVDADFDTIVNDIKDLIIDKL